MKFTRFELRTTDAPAAQRFYSSVLGEHGLKISPLPQPALARGAPAHWLGYIGVDNIAKITNEFMALGATQLGPSQPDQVIVRDVAGAVVGLTTQIPMAGERSPIAWHHLLTPSLSQSIASYSQLFAWEFGPIQTLPNIGTHHTFAWEKNCPTAGAMADISGQPGIHPHWLFHFEVAAIETATTKVHAGGGEVFRELQIDNVQIAICHDSQGAIFALRQANT